MRFLTDASVWQFQEMVRNFVLGYRYVGPEDLDAMELHHIVALYNEAAGAERSA